jgi:hypothetical protein
MRGLSSSTKPLIKYAASLLRDDHPQTLRQLHYAIFSRREIPYENSQADYKRLSRATTLARRTYRNWELRGNPNPIDNPILECLDIFAEIAGVTDLFSGRPDWVIPPDWMVDETRQPETVSVWQDMSGYIEAVKRSYRRDNWQDQPNYCEVWSEKGTIMGAIRPVADRLGVTLRVCHGFSSTGMEGQVGALFEDIKKNITVFYLGDHDPSGHVIEQDIHGRAQRASGRDFSMVRLAIHAADIQRFKLPPQQIKTSDTRAESFRRRFGASAATVELDALPASELRGRVEKAVSELIDFEIWNRQVAVQEVEFKSIAEFANRMKQLPQQEGRPCA